MLSRFAYYFDEVAKLGSIRKAAEVLNIAASAIDRQILQAEERLGTPLFERLPKGLRLTAAGEVMVHTVRQWRRDYDRLVEQIDDMKGLRRGRIPVAAVEGASDFAAAQLAGFRDLYPNISFSVTVAGSRAVAELVLSGECEIGLTFNPPQIHSLRIEETVIFQIGVVVPTDHALARRAEISFAELADYPLIMPDKKLSLRAIIDVLWAKTFGQDGRCAFEVNSIAVMKALVLRGQGIGLLTRLDVLSEVKAGTLAFIALRDDAVPLSILSLITASGRSLSPPASLLTRAIVNGMLDLRSLAEQHAWS